MSFGFRFEGKDKQEIEKWLEEQRALGYDPDVRRTKFRADEGVWHIYGEMRTPSGPPVPTREPRPGRRARGWDR